MAKILIIDDDPDLIDTYSIILTNNGYEVLSALNGEEGLVKIKNDKPDLIVLDVMMNTDYEGFEVARKIREDMKLLKLPIIMLSGIHEVKKMRYRFAPDETYLPVDIWLDKPVEPDIFLEIIRTTLSDMPQQTG